LTITGDGTATPFSAVAYNTFDQMTGENIVVDATGNNKLYLRASATVDVPMRIDLVDTAGYVTSLASLTKSLSSDMVTYEYDFSANYQDGGYGGTACETGPCPVDGSAIATVLLYPNPVDGEYGGVITVDFLSFGAPLGEDVGPVGVANYSDDFVNDDLSFISDNAGLVSTITNEEWTITGDGMSGQYAAISYGIHNQVDGSDEIATAVGSNDKLYVRVKASVNGTQLRIDLQDLEGYVTSNPSVQKELTTEYTVIEYDFVNTYTDGGFGGTPCMAGPCDVDGERINNLQFFIDPETGAYNGTVTIVDAVGSGDKLYVRAKSSNAGTVLRIDLQDAYGYVTSNPAVERGVTTEYSTIEYDYAGTYTDGGFGGTPCMTSACPVDGQRISDLQFFIDPGTGAFNGTLDIDWISFGQPLSVNVEEIEELEALQVFPNPTSGKLGIELDLSQQSDMFVTVYDGLGRVVFTQDNGSLFAGNQFEKIDLSSLNSGLYFLQVSINNKNTKAIPIIKQ